jgi:hypothetical protein
LKEEIVKFTKKEEIEEFGIKLKNKFENIVFTFDWYLIYSYEKILNNEKQETKSIFFGEINKNNEKYILKYLVKNYQKTSKKMDEYEKSNIINQKKRLSLNRDEELNKFILNSNKDEIKKNLIEKISIFSIKMNSFVHTIFENEIFDIVKKNNF